jgi:hypothetical protein
MPSFADGTADRVVGALLLPANQDYYELVNDRLVEAETSGGAAAIARITGLLDDYDAALLALSSATSSVNAGLIRADVLEWSPGSQTVGYQAEVDRLRAAIAAALLLQGIGGAQSSSTVRLCRIPPVSDRYL